MSEAFSLVGPRSWRRLQKPMFSLIRWMSFCSGANDKMSENVRNFFRGNESSGWDFAHRRPMEETQGLNHKQDTQRAPPSTGCSGAEQQARGPLHVPRSAKFMPTCEGGDSQGPRGICCLRGISNAAEERSNLGNGRAKKCTIQPQPGRRGMAKLWSPTRGARNTARACRVNKQTHRPKNWNTEPDLHNADSH